MTYKEIDNSAIQTFEYETTMISDGNIIGTCELGKASIQLLNDSNQYSVYKDSWIKTVHGSFYIYDVEPVQERVSIKLSCYDIKYKLDTPYDSSKHQFPCTLKAWRNSIFDSCNVEYDDADFPNSNLLLEKEPYIDKGSSNRTIIKLIAQAGASSVITDSTDKFYFAWFENTTHNVSDWTELTTERQTSKAINCVVLGRGDVEDNVYFPQNKPTEPIEFRIDNNYILDPQDSSISDDLRYVTIMPIYSRVNNFSYLIFSMKTQKILNKLSLKLGQRIKFLDIWRNELTAYVMTKKLNWLGGNLEDDDNYEITLSADKILESSTDLSYASNIKSDVMRVERKTDKNSGLIEDVIEESTEQSKRIAQMTLTLEEIKSEIGEIADVTVTADGNSTITVQNINESEPIKIIVKPVGEDFSYLYPSSYLYPGSNTFMKTRKIVFKNTTDDTTREYIIPRDLFYLSTNTYDEFVLDYENQECYVIHRVGKNADGTNYALQTENTEYFDYPTINLTEGDYTITLSEPTSYIFARLMTKNLYTSQFTTKVEANSKIEQSSNQILSTVSQSYATKGELNSSVSTINQTTSSIELQVQQKVGNNEIISKINQSAESITIDANKINLNGYLTISIANATYATNDNLNNNYSSNTQLATKGSTIINGDNITTGTISADRIDTSKINAVTGTIGGWNISDVQLAKTIGTYNFEIRTDRPSDQPALLVYDTSTGNYNFYVRPDGYLYSRNANISGYINATGGNFTGHVNATSGSFSGSIYSGYGTIGGWSISQDNLYGYDYNGRTITITPNGVTQKSGSGGQGTRTWFDIITDNASDKNIKNNIEKINNNDYENFFDHLKPVTFKFDKTFDKENYNKTHFGFIAQDILENESNNNLQNLSLVSENGTFLQLDKKEIIALNTWQIQKLKKQVRKQNEIIKGLAKRIEKIEKESEK